LSPRYSRSGRERKGVTAFEDLGSDTPPLLPLQTQLAENVTAMIDFRSDVLTSPTEAMWEAMRSAEPGWAGSDANVLELETLGADIVGHDAALFVPTCTMANLLALMSLGRRGSQVILEATSHIAWSEGFGVSNICGLFPRLLPGIRGVPELADVEEAIISPQFGHLPQTSLLCLENTHNNAGGTVVTAEQTAAIATLSHRHGVMVHLDGARITNAAAALRTTVKELSAPVDTVSLSLNKGLGAPYGALLCGATSTIDEARMNLNRLGAASVHKAGLFAAAAVVALETMKGQAAVDNWRAHQLAQLLVDVPGLHLDMASVQTNIVNVVVECPGWTANSFVERLASYDVLALERGEKLVRFVTHAQIGESEVEQAASIIERVMREAH